MRHLPDIVTMTSAPLRNRLRVELHAPVAEVWALVGNVTRLPEYSAGLERVDAVLNADGQCASYTCYFRPEAGRTEGIVHRETVRWCEPDSGYASSADPNNAFGLSDDLNLVTVDQSSRGTLLTWDEYFESTDVGLSQASYEQAFADIADQLIRRFDGHVVERFARPLATFDGATRTVERLTDAINRGDLPAAAALYEADATLVIEPGNVARGERELRDALRAFMSLRPTLMTEESEVFEARDLVLYHGRWRLTGTDPKGDTVVMGGESADVLRKLSDGAWRIAIDNPWGEKGVRLD